MGEGREEPSGRKGVCGATVSGLGEREGSWELKELAAGLCCEQFFFDDTQIKKNPFNQKSLQSGYSRKRTLRVRNAQARPEPSIFQKTRGVPDCTRIRTPLNV